MAKRKNSNIKLIFSAIVIAFLLVGATVFHFINADKNLFVRAGLRGSVQPDKLCVSFIDVGQGDCTLITCGETEILIDSGEIGESQKVVNYLKNRNITQIDCCIATHPHSDHIGSMTSVIESFKMGDVIFPDIPEELVPYSNIYSDFLACAFENAENVYTAQVGKTYIYGDVEIKLLAPVSDYDDLNNESIVAKITYGDTSIMLDGDAEAESETDMLKNKYDYSADIIKIGHHGSDSSSTEKWLKAVNPEYAVISCGAYNDYGHPHMQTITMMKKLGIKYYRTDILGDIVFESDGKTFEKVS